MSFENRCIVFSIKPAIMVPVADTIRTLLEDANMKNKVVTVERMNYSHGGNRWRTVNPDGSTYLWHRTKTAALNWAEWARRQAAVRRSV